MDAEERTLIYRALDEELSPADAERLRRLVHHSAEAKAEIEALHDVRTLVAEHGRTSFAPGFSSRVMDRLPQSTQSTTPRPERAPVQRQQRTRRRQQLGWSMAVLVLLIGIGWGLSQWPQTIHVPHGTTEIVTLPDGSQAELSAGSMLTYTPFWAASTRHVTLNGEAFFEVNDDRRPFVVETFNTHVVVKGTRFNVRAWADEPTRTTTVTLADGRVDLVPRTPTADSLTLAPGETSVVAGDTARASAPVTIPLDRALSWRSGGLAFVNQPLGSALRDLERRFDLRIRLREANLANRPLTYLNPKPKSATSVLSDVCHVLDLHYQRTANGFVVLRK